MRLGIRLQILFALGALLVIAFVPLYVAVANLTEASLFSMRREAASDLSRSVASHVILALHHDERASLEDLLKVQLADGGVVAIAVYDQRGAIEASAGDVSRLPAWPGAATESSRVVRRGHGPMLEVLVPTDHGDEVVAMTLALDAEGVEGNPLARLVGLYTGVIGIALLVFAYFVMTRLVVRPIEEVSHAAGRVAAGSRKLEVGSSSAREIDELSQSLREMTARLVEEEQALRAKVEELQTAKQKLESAQESIVRSERLASVGRLAAGVAHEIGNPIAAILGFEELLLAGDVSEDEQRDFLIRMRSETERVSRVLRDLLDFARPVGRTEEAPGFADVREALTTVGALLKPQKRMGSLTMEIDPQLAVGPVAISSERLQQVLLNLLLNAADAARSTIRVTAEQARGRVRVHVADDGPGIAPSVRSRLFEPFVTTKEIGEGTGLGLAVCRGLVEAAGGTLGLGETDLGGACFVLELPAYRPAPDVSA